MLTAKHIAIKVRTKCPWQYNELGIGLRTSIEIMLIFTWKICLLTLDWTYIYLCLFFQASHYMTKSISECVTFYSSIFILSQWFLDKMLVFYKSRDDFLTARAINSIQDQKIKHCSFWAIVKYSQQNARHIKSHWIFSWSFFHVLVFN